MSRAGSPSINNERGAISIMVALGIGAFLGMAALAIDLGMLMTARAEAQRTADGAALAGAGSLAFAPNNAAQARDWAKEYAARNPVRGSTIVLRDQDIDVLTDTVRVRVRRDGGYGGPITTLFARMFGRNSVDIGTVAAAEAAPSAALVNCLLPIALPDRWINFGSLEWDPSEGDSYEPPFLPSGDPNPNYAGYDTVGELFTLFPSQGGEGPGEPASSRLEPGYWDLWLPQGVSGVSEIRSRILGCPDGADLAYGQGDRLHRESGNKQTLADTFQQIINDPRYSGQYYDGSCSCVRDSNDGNQIVTSGLRYRVVPAFDPATFTQQGSGPHFTVSHFVGVFIDSVDPGPPGQANVYGRIMPAIGFGAGRPAAGLNIKSIRLVE